MIWLSVAIWGLLIGSVIGLLGGGGALISIPVLLYGFHFSFPVAVGTSLLMVTLGAMPSLLLYWRKQEVDWLSALWMGGFGTLGAWLGSLLSVHISQAFLMNLLIALILFSAWRLFKPSAAALRTHTDKPAFMSTVWLIFIGLGIGVLTGLVGVGGGFLIVPALIIIRQLEPRQAIATSLAVIVLNALSGTVGYWSRLPFDQFALYGLMAATFLGSVLGFKLSYKLSPKHLKQGFAILLLLIAAILFFNPPTHSEGIGIRKSAPCQSCPPA
jgi:uncharacterized membrane protein YfcA